MLPSAQSRVSWETARTELEPRSMLKKFAARLLDRSMDQALRIQGKFLRAKSIYLGLEKTATEESLAFIRERARGASYLPSRSFLLSFALEKVREPGLYVELGVRRGSTINHIAKKTPDRTIHGFDSFTGLPSAWDGSTKVLNLVAGDGALPAVEPNVKLHKGWFEDTLPPFAAENPGAIAFLHVDCDIYESTKTAFRVFDGKLVPGSVIVFDEYFNYWGWQNHEHRAFEEFLSHSGLSAEYLGFSENQLAVALRKKS